MGLVITPQIRHKLASRHKVTEEEISECFASRTHSFLEDDRENHRTDPPTNWFIAETEMGRVLKVVFVYEDGNIYIKSAFEPSEKANWVYYKFAKSL